MCYRWDGPPGVAGSKESPATRRVSKGGTAMSSRRQDWALRALAILLVLVALALAVTRFLGAKEALVLIPVCITQLLIGYFVFGVLIGGSVRRWWRRTHQ
jgi:hypothetical protein